MADVETPPDQTTAEQQPPTAAPAGEQLPPAAASETDWDAIEKALEDAPPDKVRKMRRFQGILGSTIQQERVAWEQTRAAEEKRRALEQAEQDMLELARNQPLEFVDKYLNEKEAEKYRHQLESVRESTANAYMRQIGVAYGNEFKLTETDIEQIGKELAGKTGDDILPAFNVAAAKIVTEREAQKRFEMWKTKELERERAALKQELATEMLKGDTSPSIRRSSPPGALRPHLLPDDKFDEWYKKSVLDRAYR